MNAQPKDFELFEWLDHITDGDQTYTLKEIVGKPGHFSLVPDPLPVIQQGTPLSQSKLGNMNDGIAFSHFTIGSMLGEVLRQIGAVHDNRRVDFEKRFVQGSATITGTPGEYFTSVYPFVLVPLPDGSEHTQTNSPNYDVSLCISNADDINAVGNLEVYDKASNGFKVRYTGSAKQVTFTWTIINTKII
ncbi:MAG: signal transduction protein [Hydrogenoanaerobacterium sp.]